MVLALAELLILKSTLKGRGRRILDPTKAVSGATSRGRPSGMLRSKAQMIRAIETNKSTSAMTDPGHCHIRIEITNDDQPREA